MRHGLEALARHGRDGHASIVQREVEACVGQRVLAVAGYPARRIVAGHADDVQSAFAAESIELRSRFLGGLAGHAEGGEEEGEKELAHLMLSGPTALFTRGESRRANTDVKQNMYHKKPVPSTVR